MLLVLQGVLPAALILLSRLVVDGLVAARAAGGTAEFLRQPLMQAGLMAFLTLLMTVLASVLAIVRNIQAELTQDYISGLIHTQAARLDMARFETPEFYDQLHRARSDGPSLPVALLQSGGDAVRFGITLVAMAAVLAPYGLWLPLALVFAAVPALYAALRANRREHAWRMRTTIDRRRTDYFDGLLTGRDSAAELRLFDLGSHFASAYQEVRKRLRHERTRLLVQRASADLIAGVATLGIGGFAMVWMVRRAFLGQATLGDVVLFFQAFMMGQGVLRVFVSSAGDFFRHLLSLENLFEFLDLRPQVVDPTQPAPAPATVLRGAQFDAVTFRYPGSDRPALDSFTLNIPAGQITAIVGENGAGKSTLVKLLLRFYDPQEGSITLDGLPLASLSLPALHQLVTVLFQEPVQFHDTAALNIAYSELSRATDSTAIEFAARASGAHEPIARLPQGYETVLGKWFGGAELSVGEWQRVALARAFLRQAQLVVLDEPTSAMDSWAEADWLSRFHDLVADRTALIITHRFTTAMRADIIHVMEHGRIVESGSHEMLVALGGRYAHSWREQMREDDEGERRNLRHSRQSPGA